MMLSLLCLDHVASLLLLLLLQGVLLPLTFPTPSTLGGQALVTERGPWPKILAPLAPLDLKS